MGCSDPYTRPYVIGSAEEKGIHWSSIEMLFVFFQLVR